MSNPPKRHPKLTGMVKLQWSNYYNWTDAYVLEEQLRIRCRPNFVVAEVCAGPNIAVPYVLNRLNKPFTYITIDLLENHIRLQKTGEESITGILADAAQLPLSNNSVDLFMFHHAIDDILETRGMRGVSLAIDDAFRTLKDDCGFMIFTHCLMWWDPDTGRIDIKDIEDILEKSFDFNKTAIESGQDWLIVDQMRRHTDSTKGAS